MSSLAKMTIMNIEKGGQISAEFNPKELSFSKSVGWSDDSPGMHTDYPALQFTAGKAIKLSVELLFDKYESAGDVRGIVKSVMDLALVDDSLKRPPMVQLLWGGSDVLYHDGSFTGVVSDVSTKYTMFLPNGVPCRAVVSVSMIQADEIVAGGGGEGGGFGEAGKANAVKQANPSLPSQNQAMADGKGVSTLQDLQNKFPDQWRDIAAGIDNPADPAQIEAAKVNGSFVYTKS